MISTLIQTGYVALIHSIYSSCQYLLSVDNELGTTLELKI